MEIEKFRNQKESNKSQLKVKSDEIFCLRSQNSKLEDLLKKCEDQIKKVWSVHEIRHTSGKAFKKNAAGQKCVLFRRRTLQKYLH